MFNQLRKGHKVVDRWYSFYPNSFNIKGVGQIVKISRKHKTADILFKDKLITYDMDHINEFICIYRRGMERKFKNKVITKEG